ncbi:MAG: hypothetical protein ACYC5O_06825 [Anaerolineae bacterium]
MTAEGWLPARVWCRSDYAYAQEPRRVAVAGGEPEEVTDVLRRWRFPGGLGFSVVAGGRRLDLQYREGDDRWQVRDRS